MTPWRRLALVVICCLAAGLASADTLVQMRPGDFRGQVELVDAYLADKFGVMYTGDPLTRWDGYAEHLGDKGYILVRYPPLCDVDGCPLLIYDAHNRNWELEAEVHVQSRVYGDLALAHYDGQLLRLRAEVGQLAFFVDRDFAITDLLSRRYWEVDIGARLELDRVYLGHADLDGDGSDELFVFAIDPWQCAAWWSHCETAVLGRDWPAAPAGPSYVVDGETWSFIHGFTMPFACPGPVADCFAVYLLDQANGGLPAILTTIAIERPVRGGSRTDQNLCGPPPGFLRSPCYQ